ncbi:SAP-like protein BP-73 [Carex littledalei]|uniref:SAP-like protein BP-73 n=1 Tax=Carex littledalei TaxID=544730 RepID=A0A833QY29_9POAL|nr:SAP-like protein BP-73 [Carex littledalei]
MESGSVLSQRLRSDLGLAPPAFAATGELLKLTDAVQRCLVIRLEANKGAQSQRNSKSKLELSLNLISETSTDEADSRKEFVSFLRKIEASIKRGPSVAERSIGGQKKQPLEPKSEDKKTSFDHTEYTGPPPEILKKDDGYKAVAPAGYETIFGILNKTGGKKAIATPRNDIKSSRPPSYSDEMIRDNSDNAVAPRRNDIKSSGPPSYSDKMIRDNGNNAVAPLRNDIKSSGPPSNFDKLIKDNGDNAVALLHDYKPPRPTSRFVRRSPIPISSPAKQEESLKQRVSIADNMRAIWEKPRDLKPELKLDRISMLKVKTTSKLRNKTKAGPKLKPNSELEAMINFKLRDVPMAELELEPNSDLEAVTILRDIPEAESELKPNSELEAMINSKLRDIPKAELELEPNSDLEAVTISELRDIPEAEPELESNSELEAVTISELGDIPKAEPELKPNSELEAVTISQLRDIPKEPELEAMTLSELRAIAKARGLKGYTRIKKAKLVEILKGTSL